MERTARTEKYLGRNGSVALTFDRKLGHAIDFLSKATIDAEGESKALSEENHSALFPVVRSVRRGSNRGNALT
jgi:hypothetical protein